MKKKSWFPLKIQKLNTIITQLEDLNLIICEIWEILREEQKKALKNSQNGYHEKNKKSEE